MAPAPATSSAPPGQITIDYLISAGIGDAGVTAAEALFASALQRSDDPSPCQVREAIAAAVAAYGGPGCSARVAQAYGEHQETAAPRMRWARMLAARALPAPVRAA